MMVFEHGFYNNYNMNLKHGISNTYKRSEQYNFKKNRNPKIDFKVYSQRMNHGEI
jgi:hypothetical protein